jgi:hypothetical protein
MTFAGKHSTARVIVDEPLGRRVAEYLVLESALSKATPSA